MFPLSVGHPWRKIQVCEFVLRALSLGCQRKCRSANVFCKGPGSKYFQLCDPDGICLNDTILPLQCEGSHRQYESEWGGHFPIKLPKADGDLGLVCGCRVPIENCLRTQECKSRRLLTLCGRRQVIPLAAASNLPRLSDRCNNSINTVPRWCLGL